MNALYNTKTAIEHGRLDYIDKSSGLAILLVVYAHILFPETLNLNWYLKSETFIYKFHMPLFMCLSGYIAFLSTEKKNIKSTGEYLKFQRKKMFKFLPVYIIFSLSSIIFDIFYKKITIREIQDSIFSLLFLPTQGSAVFVWYLYVLMGFYLITPFLLQLKNSLQYLLLVIGFLLTIITVTPLFCLFFFCKFFFFFLCGGLIYTHNISFILFLEKNGKWIILLSLILVILDFNIQLVIPYQVICLTMIPSILYISKHKWPYQINNIFTTLGVSSFAIYLFNTTLLNLYYILFKFFKLEIGHFFIFSCLLITLVIAVIIRIVFNTIVPSKIYAL